MHILRIDQQITPHVASVNASIEQRGEQRFQPHVEWQVERQVPYCESTIMKKSPPSYEDGMKMLRGNCSRGI